MRTLINIAILMLISPNWCVMAGESKLTMTPAQKAFFAEEPVDMTFAGKLPRNAKRATLEVYFSGRAVVRQELRVQTPLKAKVKFPHLKPGVVAGAEIVVTVMDGENNALEEYRRRVSFYAKDYLAERQAELKQLGVSVWSSDGNSAEEALRRVGIPFEKIRDVTNAEGKWLICTGLDFDKNDELEDDLQKCLAGGTSVLILPPIKGNVSKLKGEQSKLLFADQQHIRYLDKRLDVDSWRSKEPIAAVRFRLIAADDTVQLASGRKGEWSWVEMHHKQARLIFCGWDLIKYHRTNPAPLQILEKLLLNDKNNLDIKSKE